MERQIDANTEVRVHACASLQHEFAHPGDLVYCSESDSRRSCEATPKLLSCRNEEVNSRFFQATGLWLAAGANGHDNMALIAMNAAAAKVVSENRVFKCFGFVFRANRPPTSPPTTATQAIGRAQCGSKCP